MLSEQEQNNVLRPFQVLVIKFQSELETTREALSTEVPKNGELDEKIKQLEKGKGEVEDFITALIPRLKSADVELKEMVDELEPERTGYTSIFNAAIAHYNYKYTIEQKIDINRRLRAVRDSRLLNNADMDVLQKQLATILSMKNDKELGESRKKFEDRLMDWENLITKKNRGSR